MQVRWMALEEPGTESLTLLATPDGYRAEGRFEGMWNGEPAAGR